MGIQTATRRLALLFLLFFALLQSQATEAATGPWTFLAPAPTGNTLRDAYSPDGGTTVYHVGDGGLILKQVGDLFTVMDSGTTAPLKGIHGSGPNDIWAVGGSRATPTNTDPTHGVLLHFDGTSWTATSPPTWLSSPDLFSMADVWVSADGQAYAISDAASVPAKWNAAANKWEFEEVSDPGGILVNYALLSSIYGFAADDVYAVGSYGSILHRDATGWSATVQFENTSSSMSFNLLQNVWGPDANHVFAAGNLGQIYRLIPSQSPSWESVNPLGDLFASNSMLSMAGTGPDDIWLVGHAGVIRRWHGVVDSLENYDDATGKLRISILSVGSGNYQTDGDAGLMERMDGTTAARTGLNMPASVTAPWKAVGWSGKLWLAPRWSSAEIGISTWYGGHLTRHPIAGLGDSIYVTAFKVFSNTDFWFSGDAGGAPTLLRGNGTTWSSWLPPGVQGSLGILDVAKTPGGVYAILQYHYSVTGMPCVVGSETLQCPYSEGADAYLYAALAAADNGDFYAVGTGGRVARWHDGNWSVSVIGENGDDLNAVAAGPDMLVAVGANGSAFYSTDGAAWQAVTGVTRVAPSDGHSHYDFTAIVHAGEGVFWAVLTVPTIWTDGGTSSLYRIQNGVATLVQGGYTNPINALAAAPSQQAVFAAGEGGVIMTTNPAFHETGLGLPQFLLLLQ